MKQLNIFFTALMFFTRIPVPGFRKFSEQYLNSATMYLPLIGWIVGGVGALVFWLFSFLLPQNVSILLSMVSTIILTGAFHEDGFADVCDGFGGGWTKERILTIMKDSRVGAFGVIGTILMLFLKHQSLSQISQDYIIQIIVAGHVISRFCAVCFIFFYSYARDDASTKTKPLGKRLTVWEMLFATITTSASFYILNSIFFLLCIVPLLFTFILFSRYIVKWIGGFTGDCLGAMQQLTEVVFYISALAIVFNLI